jgi:hypothetical protein
MNLELVFQIAMACVLPGWLLLFVKPHWSGTKKLVHSGLLSALLSVIYTSVFFWDAFAGAEKVGDFWSLDAVASLFSHKSVVLVGWIHYMAFDLFVGAWIVRDSKRRGLHHGMVIPCLIMTLMLGPMGLLSYLSLKWLTRRPSSFNKDLPVESSEKESG